MKAYAAIALLCACCLMIAGCAAMPAAKPAASPIPTASAPAQAASAYKDGTYEVTCGKDGEGYFVKGTMTITGGMIVSAEWAIYDSNRQDKVFDKDYETVYTGQDMYIQQCRDNLKGMAGYSSKLVETQSLDDVDVVSGATWAYHKFEQFVIEALKEASTK